MVSAPPLEENHVAAKSMSTTVVDNDFVTTIQVEPVGRWFQSHWNRLHAHRAISEHNESGEIEVTSDDDSDDDNSGGEEEIEFEDDIVYLRSLDPKEIKDQDHYRVLGLTSVRIKATAEQVKKAHRFKVLKHHPDKRRAAGEEVRDDDDYFTCITKAAEILSNPVKRRAFDSVDPTFDDSVPPEIKSGDKVRDFYADFATAFERNSRWSAKKHVPKLGDDSTSRDRVDKFYRFWYEFESWREFSYLDEEDKEGGSDRYERRWIEKNNRIERAEKKREEMRRIRKLVDNAYNSDPRVARFKEADRAEKAERKRARAEAARARKEEEERLRKEEEAREKKEREEKEAAERSKLEAARKEKEAAKKILKKERKALRTICKDANFFSDSEDERVRHMTDVDRLCEILGSEQLVELNAALEKERQADAKKSVFLSAVSRLNSRQEEEKRRMVEQSSKGASGGGGERGGGKGGNNWSSDEMALLIKAVNLFPAGTNQRWEVVANFVNQHTKTPEIRRHAKETLSKAKELQSGDFHLSQMKEETNKRAYENLEKQKKRDVKVETEASKRTETAAEMQGLNVTPWTEDEQKLLEQALKTYPASVGAERWDKIAGCVPNRSKKDCMRRYKELAEIVRAKKAAMAAAAAGGKS